MKKCKLLLAFSLAVLLVASLVPAQAAEGALRILVEPSLVYDIVYPFRDGFSEVYKDEKGAL